MPDNSWIGERLAMRCKAEITDRDTVVVLAEL
jgi:hypothetical protein